MYTCKAAKPKIQVPFYGVIAGIVWQPLELSKMDFKKQTNLVILVIQINLTPNVTLTTANQVISIGFRSDIWAITDNDEGE